MKIVYRIFKPSVKKYFNLFCCLLCVSVPALAQEILHPKDAIAVAIANNYDIQLVRNDSVAYAIDQSFSKAAFLPTVNATGGILFNNNNQKQTFSDGTKRQRNGVRSNQLTGALLLNWTLFDGFKMFATRDKLTSSIALGNVEIQRQVVTTAATVLKTYYNIVYQKEQLAAIEEQLAIDAERIKLAQKKLDVGLGAKPELLQAKVDRNARLSAKLQQENTIANLKQALNQLMQTDINKTYDVEDTLINGKELMLGDVLNEAQAKNPSLLSLKQNKEVLGFSLKEARSGLYPLVNFNAAYNFSRNDNKTVVNPFQPLLSSNRGFNYGLSFSVPIFNNYTVKRNIKLSKLAIERNDISYEKQLADIQRGIYDAYKSYTMQKQILQVEEENILLAKENVFIIFQRFKNGLGIYLELREAQKSLDDAYRRLFAARYNAIIAEVDLKALKGDVGIPE